MTGDEQFDPFAQGSNQAPELSTNSNLSSQVRLLQAKTDAFRDVADRFYMLWWNLPEMNHRQVDQEVVDLFRMFMDLAPSLGVSRNMIPELRECCGRFRSPFPPDAVLDPRKTITGAQGIISPFREPDLGWCPGDLIRRFTRMLGFKFCEKCDGRRRSINAFFRCGKA